MTYPIDLRQGDYRTALADVVSADLLCCDPPYSSRTHASQRTGASIRVPTIKYDAIDQAWCQEFAASWAPRVRNWVVLFCDHTAFNWHDAAWRQQGWLTFAPVFLKSNPTPRFSGDGPAFALEFLLVARPRRADVRPRGSLPAVYESAIGDSRGGLGISGRKPLTLIRAVVRDYSLPGDLVVDATCGSGTTLIAAALEGRRAIGAELDATTYATALRRIQHGDHAARQPEQGTLGL